MHVLLALAKDDLHGYGMLLAVARQSQGAYTIGPGTLYANLRKLVSRGLVEEAERQRSESPTRGEYLLNPGTLGNDRWRLA